MHKGNFEIIIASSRERENVFCEILYKNQYVCDITQEHQKLVLNLYTLPPETIQMPLEEFQDIIEIAKQHLLGNI